MKSVAIKLSLAEIGEVEFSDMRAWPGWFRWLMVVLMGVGLWVSGFYFLINPQIEDLARLEKDEQQLRNIFLQKKERAVNLPAYRQQLAEVGARLDKVVKQLPSSSEVPDLLLDISQAGLNRGLNFKEFMPGELQQSQFYSTLPIAITVSGEFHNLSEFISDLAALPRIVTVGDMQITPLLDAENKLQMNASLFTFEYGNDLQEMEKGGESNFLRTEK